MDGVMEENRERRWEENKERNNETRKEKLKSRRMMKKGFKKCGMMIDLKKPIQLYFNRPKY